MVSVETAAEDVEGAAGNVGAGAGNVGATDESLKGSAESLEGSAESLESSAESLESLAVYHSGACTHLTHAPSKGKRTVCRGKNTFFAWDAQIFRARAAAVKP